MVQCSAGYYSLENELECTVSPAGYYTFKGRTDQDPTEITDQYYYSDIGMTFKELVPWGRESRDFSGRHMVTCPPGYYTDPTTTACTICEAGKYCPSTLGESLTEGFTCVDGTYSDSGWTECLPCKPGYDC